LEAAARNKSESGEIEGKEHLGVRFNKSNRFILDRDKRLNQ
jgi:hypothetical protein